MNTKASEAIIKSIIGRMVELEGDELSQFLKAVRDRHYKYLVCYDMGCGNTSVAYSSIGGLGEPSLVQWKYDQPYGNRKFKEVSDISIPTMLGYDDDEPVIGPGGMRYGETVENFKKLPTKDNLDNSFYPNVGEQEDVSLRKVWKHYFRKTFEMCLEEVQEKYVDANKKNVIFVVARPADPSWKENLDEYRTLIAQGTGLKKHQILTFSEAKAAMQYVKLKKLPLDWNKGVVIIDLGASTIDVEYIADNNAVPVEFSITMAGREVDRLLGHEMLRHWYAKELDELEADEIPDEDFFRNHIDELEENRPTFLYDMRMIKENVCDGVPSFFASVTSQGDVRRVNYDANQLKHLLGTEKFSFQCYDPFIAQYMNEMTGGKKGIQKVTGTWYDHLENFVSYVMETLKNSGKKVNSIIVTGGTSRLVGIADYIKSGVVKAGMSELEPIILSERADYERTVPYGSFAYLNKAINKIPYMLDFPVTLQSKLRTDLVQTFPAEFTNCIYPYLLESVLQIIKAWVNLPDKHRDASDNGLTLLLKTLSLSSFKVERSVKEAMCEISNMTDDGQYMSNTKDVIGSFFQELADTKYDPLLDLSTACCHMNTKVIGDAVKNACVTNGTYGQFVSGFFRSLGYIFTSVDKPLSHETRQNIYDNFTTRNTIKKDILEPITNEFSKVFDQSEGEMLVNQILTDMEPDINRALYLSDMI